LDSFLFTTLQRARNSAVLPLLGVADPMKTSNTILNYGLLVQNMTYWGEHCSSLPLPYKEQTFQEAKKPKATF